jgi:hypothetical protein
MIGIDSHSLVSTIYISIYFFTLRVNCNSLFVKYFRIYLVFNHIARLESDGLEFTIFYNRCDHTNHHVTNKYFNNNS